MLIKMTWYNELMCDGHKFMFILKQIAVVGILEVSPETTLLVVHFSSIITSDVCGYVSVFLF